MITPATDRIDAALKANPRVGIEITEGLWKYLSHPMLVYYSFSDDDRLVTMIHVIMLDLNN